MNHAMPSQSGKIWVYWSALFLKEPLQDMDQVVHCQVSRSLFYDFFFFIYYVYAWLKHLGFLDVVR